MNNLCSIANCPANCCNIDGVCPISQGTYEQTHCYYNNSNPYQFWNSWWLYLSITAIVVLLVTFTCLLVRLKKRNKNKNEIIIVTGQQTPSYTYG